MKRLLLSIVSIIIIGIAASNAQNFTCGTDEVHKQMLQSDTGYQYRQLQNENRILVFDRQRRVQPHNVTTTILTVPVVVHFIHTGDTIGTEYNPTVLQAENAIAYLNQVFNGTYPGLENTTDVGIKFILAKRDPDCNPTNGITRTDASSIPGYVQYGVNYAGAILGADELILKNLTRWNPSQYYNIYVVNKITGGLFGIGGSGGFAYYPGASPNYDGTVITTNCIVAGNAVFPHEIGHAFNLAHPFDGSSGNVCPNNNSCATQGDRVCDTDPITQPGNFECRTGTNSCTGTAFNYNTEHNIMNYTACRNLFTAGQILRMQASASTAADRTIFANSLAGIPTNEGDVQCIPKINFEIDATRIVFSPDGQIDCREYRDYVYGISIGNKPSAAADITITVNNSTAIEHTDFDINTSNDFSTLDKTIVFYQDVDSTRHFILRVYNVPSDVTSKTLTLGFIVNSNGGSAVAGTLSPAMKVTILSKSAAPHLDENRFYVFGDTTNAGIQSPFDGRQETRKSQVLYKAREMSKKAMPPGIINGLSLFMRKRSAAGAMYNSFSIKMGHTNQQHLYEPGVSTPVNDLTHTLVFSADYTPVNGWNDFNFSTPFIWDGVSNIVVTYCYGSNTSDTVELVSYYTDSIYTQNMVDYVFASQASCGAAINFYSYYYNGYKPSIKLKYLLPETPVQTGIYSQTQYLGAYADVFFYDSLQNKVIARIKNLSAFDYGCTQLQIDRSGNAAYPFLDNDAAHQLLGKTFKILPTFNNPEGQYEVTLYYTKPEITAWQAATGQSFTNIQLIKVDRQIADVSPANPTGGGFVLAATPAKDSLGNIRSVTGLFNNGFSGFGAGVAVTNMYTFSGTGNWSDAVNWSNNSIPPAVLPLGAQIIIKPVAGGECILDTAQTILKGAVFYINPGAKFRVLGNLEVQQ